MNDANLDRQVRALTAKIYRYCYERFHCRVTTRRDQLEKFWGHFQRVCNFDDPFQEQLYNVLLYLCGQSSDLAIEIGIMRISFRGVSVRCLWLSNQTFSFEDKYLTSREISQAGPQVVQEVLNRTRDLSAVLATKRRVSRPSVARVIARTWCNSTYNIQQNTHPVGSLGCARQWRIAELFEHIVVQAVPFRHRAVLGSVVNLGNSCILFMRYEVVLSVPTTAASLFVLCMYEIFFAFLDSLM